MSQEIKHSTRVVRGINYSIGRQDFVVNVFCQLHYLGILRDVLSDVFDKTQLAICALPQKKKGSYCICTYNYVATCIHMYVDKYIHIAL